MSRPTKMKYPDDRRLIESRKIEFLYWQYAMRKFHFDCANNIVNYTEWKKHYFELFRAIVKRYCKDYVEVNGVILNKEVALSGEGVYGFYETSPKFIFNRLNEIITRYHNSINDNPEFVFDFIFEYEGDMLENDRNSHSYFEFIDEVIHAHKDNLGFIRSICLKYGYYPKELMILPNTMSDYNALCRDTFDAPESFIRIEKYSSIVRAHFVSESGKCYFEDHEKGFLYLYLDVFLNIDIDKIIKDVRRAISNKGKRNFLNEIRYADVPNMQLCINIIGKYNKRNIEDEVRYALLSAINYYNPLKHSFFKEMQDVQWRVLQAKYKKLSYLRRFVGLFIWDGVHVQGLNLGDVIAALIEAVNASASSLSPKSALPENILRAIREWADLIRADISTGMVLETSSLDREYRLAHQSIQTLSICQHEAGNVNNMSI